MTGVCFGCGVYDTVEKHHIFQGALRKKADKLKLTVYLCPYCHQYAADSAHRSYEARVRLRKYGQIKAMREQDWSVEDFVREFGKNYLDPEEIAQIYDEPEDNADVFQLVEAGAELPW